MSKKLRLPKELSNKQISQTDIYNYLTQIFSERLLKQKTSPTIIKYCKHLKRNILFKCFDGQESECSICKGEFLEKEITPRIKEIANQYV